MGALSKPEKSNQNPPYLAPERVMKINFKWVRVWVWMLHLKMGIGMDLKTRTELCT